MQTLSQLAPQSVWQIFEKICSIPHPSYHEAAIAEHIVSWAKAHNWHVERDATGNILIRKPATAGLEHLTPVVLQGHLDMVPQKADGVEHDFEKDPIQPYIDGEWVKAKGTTLGADNGLGMASALAVLVDESVEHGPLEVLLTMTEEAGMEGAFGLQPDWLEAKILINTDSETEGEIYMGCAGGIDAVTEMKIERTAMPAGMQPLEITLKGLKGGHSGGDIHLGLGNAIKLLARFLATNASTLDYHLINFNGGTLRNAIPREGHVVVAVAKEKVAEFKQAFADFFELICHELEFTEKNMVFSVKEVENHLGIYSADCQQRLINLLNVMPNGVIRMSNAVEGVVETSLNVGVVASSDDSVKITCLIRSLVDSGKEYVVEILRSLSELAGAKYTAVGGYPGWQPDPGSEIMHIVKKAYEDHFKAEPNVMVIHAGLECGLFKKPYPLMDMVSIGPTIRGAHSPDERAHIESVARYWTLLTNVLKAVPAAK